MVKLDSDILGILFAIITFLLPAISALLDKKRKKSKGGIQAGDVDEPVRESDEDSPFFSIQSVIDEVVEELKQAETADELEMVENPVEEQEGIEDEVVETVKVEEAEPATVPASAVLETQVSETPVSEAPANDGEGIKGRLKSNPKDMVIFAEIMNPKFKEL